MQQSPNQSDPAIPAQPGPEPAQDPPKPDAASALPTPPANPGNVAPVAVNQEQPAVPPGLDSPTPGEHTTAVSQVPGTPGLLVQERRKQLRLALGALGVVYGDIGTSPLYAVRECFNPPPHGTDPTPENVLGVLSLIFWALMMVVVVKYLTFVMRADNRGEGGILALLALLIYGSDQPKSARGFNRQTILTLLGLFGTALLLADGMITPAISVLSAIEGLEVVAPSLEIWVIPITIFILVALFLVQRHGTARIAGFFGPTMLLWFAMISLMGLPWIFREPGILKAVSPWYALELIHHHPWQTFFLLGAVVLCVTGAEALYADMGHFGRGAIRRAWYVVAFPALLINYFGQGAFILSRQGQILGEHHEPINIFYSMVPTFLLIPVMIMATAATIIASQALISGAYSLAQQAVQLGYSPRLAVVHTSHEMAGQIYIPFVNHTLMIACILLVLGFRSSSNLAAAYGIAVVGTMLITSLLLYDVSRVRWGWSRGRALGLLLLLLAVDIPFLASNMTKFAAGGWVPVLVAGGLLAIMTTWARGRILLLDPLYSVTFPMSLFLRDVERTKPVRVQGVAVFMASKSDAVPAALLHHFKHNQVLHNRIVLFTVLTSPVPKVEREPIVEVKELGHGFFHVIARHGFMESPDVPVFLRLCKEQGLDVDPQSASYYLGRMTLLTTGKAKLFKLRKQLFAFLYRNERPATSFFNIPPNRVVELGRQVEL